MAFFNIGDLLGPFRTTKRKIPERISVGDVVRFHDGSYAEVISWEEYTKLSGRPKPNESVIKGIKSGEWYCLQTKNGAYFLLPSSALEKVNGYDLQQKEIML